MTVHNKKSKARHVFETADDACSRFVVDVAKACSGTAFPKSPWPDTSDDMGRAGGVSSGARMREFGIDGLTVGALMDMGFSCGCQVHRSEDDTIHELLSFDQAKNTLILKCGKTGRGGECPIH